MTLNLYITAISEPLTPAPSRESNPTRAQKQNRDKRASDRRSQGQQQHTKASCINQRPTAAPKPVKQNRIQTDGKRILFVIQPNELRRSRTMIKSDPRNLSSQHAPQATQSPAQRAELTRLAAADELTQSARATHPPRTNAHCTNASGAISPAAPNPHQAPQTPASTGPPPAPSKAYGAKASTNISTRESATATRRVGANRELSLAIELTAPRCRRQLLVAVTQA